MKHLTPEMASKAIRSIGGEPVIIDVNAGVVMYMLHAPTFSERPYVTHLVSMHPNGSKAYLELGHYDLDFPRAVEDFLERAEVWRKYPLPTAVNSN